jgi:hypothetical protein
MFRIIYKVFKHNYSKMELFKELGNFNSITNETRVVAVDEFKDKYSILKFGNGASWCRRGITTKYKIATMKNNGIINYLWNTNEIDIETVNKTFDFYEKMSGKSIRYVKIFGLKENSDESRYIRKDIRDFYKNKSCSSCGSSRDLVCDHKNDLYNDTRVLNSKTQTLDDFQSLCNSCNLRKRDFCIKMKKTGKRIGISSINPSLACFNDFNKGDDTYDSNDVNALLGTYWYGPIEFIKNATRK